jgi:hypothetical protein
MVNKIKKYYDKGLYKKAHIAALVQTGTFSTADYESIVGEAFPEGISTEKVPTNTDIAIKDVKRQISLLEAKNRALSESNMFLEECLVEMAEIVYA